MLLTCMKHILLILLMLPCIAVCQVNDNFSDGDFSNNPSWLGDSSQFIVNSQKSLQLHSSGTDSSYLSTANTQLSETEWDFYVKLSFSPSDNNNARIYLVSDQSTL